MYEVNFVILMFVVLWGGYAGVNNYFNSSICIITRTSLIQSKTGKILDIIFLFSIIYLSTFGYVFMVELFNGFYVME